jgi:hypothetical protein
MATLSQVGIAGVGNGVLQPKAKNRWRVIFTGLGGVSGSNASIPNDLSLQVITAARPSLSYEEVQLDRYNSRVYVAGKHTFEPCALTVEDDVTNRATNAIQTQLEMQQRLIGATGPWLNAAATAFSYKFGMQLEMLDGNEAVTEAWKYEGCFLQAVNWGDLDYATGERVVIDLTVRYDHVRQTLNSVVTGSAIGGLING